MNYCIITYGCQMNEADSDLMADLLTHSGWQAVANNESADLIIVNTCSVRERPEHKVYSLLGELREWKQARPEGMLVVAGCMAQRAAADIVRRAPHVNVIVGTGSFHRIEDLVKQARTNGRPVVALDMEDDPNAARCQEIRTAAPLRAFVPIIRGCSNFCSYCIVPYVRGEEASRSMSEIAREVESLVSRGTREVTLLGQNVLAYGRDLVDVPTFPDLLAHLNSIDDLWRIRFTTSHPRDVTDALITAMADLPKVCEHIHLPIQAGTDRLLQEMNRGYTTEHYISIVEQLRARVPGLAITTDIMVGFPGETGPDFEASLRLYKRLRFDAAFTFAYSPRPGTAAAARHDQVPRPERIERLNHLIEVQNQITLERNADQIGEEAEVLVDGPAPHGEGLLAGKMRSNKQVVFPGDVDLTGCLIRVRLAEAHLWGFVGELLASDR
jgi:tRNA-2-methylthio-N6-dimethylallyladenosine synthase